MFLLQKISVYVTVAEHVNIFYFPRDFSISSKAYVVNLVTQEVWNITTCILNVQHVIVCSYVLQSSGISWTSEALIVRYSQKKKWIPFVFYCSENHSIAHNFGTTGPIQVRFSAKCTSPNEHFNEIENWKRHMLDFGLISLDRITYYHVHTQCT